ncbi:MAG: hypothetical protein AB7G37_06390 [Solirubrobacteraceae bacterium]
METTTVTETEPRTVWQLARLAGCMNPDSLTSPGAGFLEQVARDTADRLAELAAEGDDLDPETIASDEAHMIADGAVPVGTYAIWVAFTDLGAWEALDEYLEDSGTTEVSNDHGDGMTARAALGLFLVAERLAVALIEEAAE